MISIEELRVEVRRFFDGRFVLRDPEDDDEREDTIAHAPDGHDALVDSARDLQQALAGAGSVGRRRSGGVRRARSHALPRQGHRRGAAPLRRAVAAAARHRHAPRRGDVAGGGLPEQKRRYLPALIRADEQWCQLFSEPDAGSDLVSLRTRAVSDGDEWVIDGQKVWSSYAAHAHFGLLLARTDPEAPKPQLGITMFILPMDAPGVTVRPLVDMAGGRHFNEVFAEGVRVADDAVIGEVDRGWGVSQGTLGGERSGYMGGSGNGRRRRQVGKAAQSAGTLTDPVIRQRMMGVVTAERVLEWARDRYVGGVLADGNPAGGSMMTLAAGTLEQRCSELIADITGAGGQAWDSTLRDGDIVSHDLNATRQARIAGGTHQIQRNLLGERVLQLPREPK